MREFKEKEPVGQRPHRAYGFAARDAGARLGIPRGQLAWLVLALLLLPVPAIALIARHDAGTIVAALLFVLGIGLSMWMMPDSKQRVVAGDPADPAVILQTEIEEARSGLRHADAWIRLFPLGILLAAMLKLSAFSADGLNDFFPRLLGKVQRGESTLLAVLVLLFVLIHFVRRSLYFRTRVRRLEALRSHAGDALRG